MSSILMIRSPALTPARNAGVSSIGEITLIMPSSTPTSMPRPPNLPWVEICNSLNASASRKSECGSSPCDHAIDRFADQLVVRHRLDVVALDAAEHRREELQVFVGDRQAGVALRQRREVEAQQQPEHRAQTDPSCLFPAVTHVCLVVSRSRASHATVRYAGIRRPECRKSLRSLLRTWVLLPPGCCAIIAGLTRDPPSRTTATPRILAAKYTPVSLSASADARPDSGLAAGAARAFLREVRGLPRGRQVPLVATRGSEQHVGDVRKGLVGKEKLDRSPAPRCRRAPI